MEITYIERKTGEKRIEKVYGSKSLMLLYGEGFLNSIVSFFLLPLLSYFPYASRFYGYLMKRASSAKKIAPFIKSYGIDESEFASSDFRSFNDFFIRKLKPEARPIAADPNAFAAPADGRYLVFPQFDRFFVKDQEFFLEQFLQDSSLAHRYSEGSMAIIRLCPTDYHRYHFPCDGTPGEAKLINGALFSVNPIALRKKIAILSENKRMLTEIETEKFGTLLYIEVGATSVGSIRQTYTPNRPVKKGEEKGYFEFGGSCLVLLFEKGRIRFDEDLAQNTRSGFETLLQFGEPIACSST